MNADVEDVKRRLNILDVVQAYVPLRKSGATWKGLCPFHQEKSPSFTVNVDRQSYHCFGCGEGGDAIDFVMKMEHLTFPEALQMLADRVGVILDKRKTPAQYAQEKDEKSRLYQINRIAADVFHKILLEHPKAAEAREYLKNRGLTDATLKSFRLGYAPPFERGSVSVLEKFLTQRGFSATERRNAGSPERFSNRIIFPLWDTLGNPIGFTGRALAKDDQPKYLNTPETPLFKKGRVLYPLHLAKDAIKTSARAILVEGQMDVLTAHQLGAQEAVATSGTALTTEHLQILGRYSNKLYFCFDADDAGREATRKAILLAFDLELEPYVLSMPAGFKDVGELAVTAPEKWPAVLSGAQPAFEWQLQTAQEMTNEPSSALGKKTIAQVMLPVLGRIRDPIERAHWVQIFARRIAIPERSILDALDRHLNRVNSKQQTVNRQEETNENKPAPQQVRLSPQTTTLFLLLLHPEEFKNGNIKINPEDFAFDSHLARLVKAMNECYNPADTITQEQFLTAVRAALPSADAKWLDDTVTQVEHLSAETDSSTVGSEIRAGLDRLRTQRQEVLKEQMAAAIANAETSGNRDEVKKLLQQLQEMFK